MSDVDSWLQRYEDTHQNLRNPVVYWAAVPMIVVGTVGILWDLPVPPEFIEISPLLNWGSAFLMATAIYYFIISLALAIGMLPFLLGIASLHQWLAAAPWPHSGLSISFLLAGTVGLVLGRLGKGWFKAVIEDFQLMMIGPAWLLK